MSEARLKELMSELMLEIQDTDGVDADTVLRAKQLHSDVQQLIDPDIDTSENTILDDAIALEASFAASHPVAEKTIRELINTLSRIGI